jgi:hypothetical protein
LVLAPELGEFIDAENKACWDEKCSIISWKAEKPLTLWFFQLSDPELMAMLP